MFKYFTGPGNRRKEQIKNWHAKVQNVHWAWVWKRYGL
jgi:hypothetical protein